MVSALGVKPSFAIDTVNVAASPVGAMATRASRRAERRIRARIAVPTWKDARRTENLRAYRPSELRALALRELRGLARLVQAGLLALDDASVAREEALPLQRHTH